MIEPDHSVIAKNFEFIPSQGLNEKLLFTKPSLICKIQGRQGFLALTSSNRVQRTPLIATARRRRGQSKAATSTQGDADVTALVFFLSHAQN